MTFTSPAAGQARLEIDEHLPTIYRARLAFVGAQEMKLKFDADAGGSRGLNREQRERLADSHLEVAEGYRGLHMRLSAMRHALAAVTLTRGAQTISRKPTSAQLLLKELSGPGGLQQVIFPRTDERDHKLLAEQGDLAFEEGDFGRASVAFTEAASVAPDDFAATYKVQAQALSQVEAIVEAHVTSMEVIRMSAPARSSISMGL